MTKKLKKYKIISFDIFDTLIRRYTKEPKEIFQVVENLYNIRYGKKGDFCTRRIKAEEAAREKNSHEVTLNQIYEELCIEDKERYKQLELETELRYSAPNPKGKKLYFEALKSGKKNILISDMYLPRKIIEQILYKCGICGYSKIYISCEYGMTKLSGKLYDFVSKDLKTEFGTICHIGDNFKSDYIMAKKHGFDAYYFGKDKYKGENELERFLKFNYLGSKDSNEYIGYCCLGPLLFGFSKWLNCVLKQHRYDKILFLSRDGWIIKKAYESIYGDIEENVYFYASRKALLTASFCLQADYDEIIKSMFIPRRFKLSWLLDRWGIDKNDNNIKLYLKNNSMQLDSYEDGKRILENKLIRGLFELCKETVINSSRKQYRSFLDYWDSICTGNRVAIIDIGWYGNMQKTLEKLLDSIYKDIKIDGYYLGLVPFSENLNHHYMKGYLFDRDKNIDIYWKEKYFNTLLELLFIAPHGSLKSYEGLFDKVFSFEKYEYKDTNTDIKISIIQEKALEFILAYKEIGLIADLSEKQYFKNMMKVFSNPTCHIAKEYGDIQIFDAGRKYLARPQPFCRYADNNFISCSWKVGYLKRLFRISLPYADILIFIRLLLKGDK